MGGIGEYWRDVRAARKETEERYPSERCYDWMIGMGPSYARDRASFKTYRRISANVGDALSIERNTRFTGKGLLSWRSSAVKATQASISWS